MQGSLESALSGFLPFISTASLYFIGPHSQHSSKTATIQNRSLVLFGDRPMLCHWANCWPESCVVYASHFFFNLLDHDNSQSPLMQNERTSRLNLFLFNLYVAFSRSLVSLDFELTRVDVLCKLCGLETQKLLKIETLIAVSRPLLPATSRI